MSESDGNWSLITGATMGIGYEMARILASKGHNLILVCRNEERLCQVARELNEVSDIIIMPVDLSKAGSSAILFSECDRLGLKINVMINFAKENN
jgi:short-subunit dehydrogenase